jgi:hypothetical protein
MSERQPRVRRASALRTCESVWASKQRWTQSLVMTEGLGKEASDSSMRLKRSSGRDEMKAVGVNKLVQRNESAQEGRSEGIEVFRGDEVGVDLLSHPDFRDPKSGREIITKCARIKSHTYDDS